MYTIAVFSSRNETLYFANMLRSKNLYSMIINTPNGIGKACGVSVKFDERNLNEAKRLLSLKPFKSFIGFYIVKFEGGRFLFEKIN